MNPTVLLEIGALSTPTSTETVASTLHASEPSTPAIEEPSTDECRQTETTAEDSESRVPQKESDSTVPSSQGESSRKKRKLTKVQKAEEDITAALKSITKQGIDLKDTLLALDEKHAKQEEQQERQEMREI